MKRWLIVLILTISSAVAQSSFEGPADLRTGVWAEGMAEAIRVHGNPETTDIQRYANFYADNSDSILRRAARLDYRRRFNFLKEKAQEFIAHASEDNFRLLQFNSIARSLYLLQQLTTSSQLRTDADYRIASDLLILGFLHANQMVWPEMRIYSMAEYTYAEYGRSFARRLYAITPQISNPMARHRVLRSIIEILLWDISRDPSLETYEQDLASAQVALHRNASIAELDGLAILPVPRIHSSGEAPFGNDQYSAIRAQAWQIYQVSFERAAQCGQVLCVANNGQGNFFTSLATRDGEAQEKVIADCMNLSVELPEIGLNCRNSMVCVHQRNLPPEVLLSEEMRGCALGYHQFSPSGAVLGVDPRGHERQPWWLRPR